jgi:hypothetical protein
MAPPSPRAPARPRAFGNRFADAGLLDGELIAVGVRFDEDDHDVGESMVVRLRPGRCEPIGRVDGVARALVVVDGTPHVLLGDGRLVHIRDTQAKDVAGGVVDVVAHGVGALALFADGVVATVGAPVTQAFGIVPGGRRLASDGTRVVVATKDAVVDVARAVTVLEHGGDAVTVVDNIVAVVGGNHVVVGDGRSVRTFPAPHALHSIARFAGRTFVGSRAAGLFLLLDDDDRVRPLRPSLRARSLRVGDGRLLVTADLFVACSNDGEDFVSRDLAGFIRLAEKSG